MRTGQRQEDQGTEVLGGSSVCPPTSQTMSCSTVSLWLGKHLIPHECLISSRQIGLSKLKWTGMGEFNSDDHYIYYCGQESLRRNGVAIIVSKRVWNAVLGCNLKNDRMISAHFQCKPYNITVIQVYAPTSNTEEAEVEWFYEDLQDFLNRTPHNDVLFIIGTGMQKYKRYVE